MKRSMTHGEIVNVFAGFGIDPIERDVRELRELMGAQKPQEPVFYRAVLTDGTGRLQFVRKEAENAELQRDIS